LGVEGEMVTALSLNPDPPTIDDPLVVFEIVDRSDGIIGTVDEN
jgi:hypothetical protein